MMEQQAPKLNSNGTPSKVLPEFKMTDRVEGVYECECICLNQKYSLVPKERNGRKENSMGEKWS